MKRIPAVLFLSFVCAASVRAQSKATITAYIEKHKAIAMAEMMRTGVPASITLAQGIHETGAGTSRLVTESNNHFGIKCKTEWQGERVYHDDDARGECFRKYNDGIQSYRDHSDFLKTRAHYAPLFALDPTDYEAWAHGLKKAGYATNPKYPQILIKLIQDHNLQDYTLIAMGVKKDQSDAVVWASATTTVATEAEMPAVKTVYPQGVFKINDTKVTAVAKGTSYLMIAEEYNLSLARLLEFNDLPNTLDVAAADGLVYLQRKRKTGAADFHVVAAAETLHEIAQHQGIRMESLLGYNMLTAAARVAVGEKLYLTTGAPSAPRLATDAPVAAKAVYKPEQPLGVAAPEYLTHTVQPKETLFAVARKYEVSVDDVMKWNDLQDRELKIGQQIKIKQTH